MQNAELRKHLLSRPAELKKMKNRGAKIVAYLAGEYVPEEIIHASGAAPVCLIHGGDPESVEAAHSAITRFVCPFSKAQIGYRFIGEQPYYLLMDLLIAPITCQHLRRVADMYNYYTEVDVFRMGIPFEYNTEHALKYYAESLKLMAGKLEQITGNSITEEGLRQSVHLYNRMRTLFKEIALMRKTDHPPISSLDFVKLNHASFHADPQFMVETLESVRRELVHAEARPGNGPRLFLMGPNLSLGDYKIPELIQTAGGHVVAEYMDEGIRYFWENVETDGDIWEGIARRYLQKRLPCVYMVKPYRARLDFLLKMVKDFKVDGMVWYQLKYCDTADIESFYLAEKVKEAGIPLLRLESEYDVSDRGPLQTRIEAFIETLERRVSHERVA